MEVTHLTHDLVRNQTDVFLGETAPDVRQLVQVPVALPNEVAHKENLVLRLKGIE